jgi:hypothetical protein
MSYVHLATLQFSTVLYSALQFSTIEAGDVEICSVFEGSCEISAGLATVLAGPARKSLEVSLAMVLPWIVLSGRETTALPQRPRLRRGYAGQTKGTKQDIEKRHFFVARFFFVRHRRKCADAPSARRGAYRAPPTISSLFARLCAQTLKHIRRCAYDLCHIFRLGRGYDFEKNLQNLRFCPRGGLVLCAQTCNIVTQITPASPNSGHAAASRRWAVEKWRGHRVHYLLVWLSPCLPVFLNVDWLTRHNLEDCSYW